MEHLIASFLRAGLYLKNWSPRTHRTYATALSSLALAQTELTKKGLEGWVIAPRAKGLTPGGVNVYIRTVNSFLSWLRRKEQKASPHRSSCSVRRSL